jgi:hypothetical protein
MKLIICVASLGAVALLGPALLRGAAAEDTATAKAELKDANGMDRPRSGPQRLSECVGACQEKEQHHASHVHCSCSDRHRNRYGQEHASHDRLGFPRRHRVAREGITRTDCIETYEPATLARSTQKPFSTLWYVTRSTSPPALPGSKVPAAESCGSSYHLYCRCEPIH